MAVARPSNPERVVELVEEIKANPEGKNPVWARPLWKALEKQLADECSPYTFVGYLARSTGTESEENPAGILDAKGKEIDIMRVGDSIIRESEWRPAAPGKTD